jgi:mRNA interferase RelE/StbE
VNARFRASFAKDLRSIQDTELLHRIRQSIQQVENAQRLQDVADVKKLKTRKGNFRIRVGDYRIGIVAVADTITMVPLTKRRANQRCFVAFMCGAIEQKEVTVCRP